MSNCLLRTFGYLSKRSTLLDLVPTQSLLRMFCLFGRMIDGLFSNVQYLCFNVHTTIYKFFKKFKLLIVYFMVSIPYSLGWFRKHQSLNILMYCISWRIICILLTYCVLHTRCLDIRRWSASEQIDISRLDITILGAPVLKSGRARGGYRKLYAFWHNNTQWWRPANALIIHLLNKHTLIA